MWHKRSITKIAFKLHGWLGLSAGIFFVLFGVTGSMLMFRQDLDRHFNPELHVLKTASHQVSVDQIYRMLVRTHPNLKKIVLHDFPADAHDSYEFMLYKNQQNITENYLYYVFVDPYNGKILKEGNYQDFSPSFLRWLYSFHYSLQLGFPGKLFTAIIGLVMLLSLITGTIIYRKHFWDALRFKAGLNFKNRRTAVSALHRLIGVWSMLFTAVLFFTGFWLNIDQFKPISWQLYKPHQNTLVKANIDDLIKRSIKTVPGFKPIAVNIPADGDQEVLVRGSMPNTPFFLLQGKPSGILFDGESGRLKIIKHINNQPFATRFNWEVYQLHIGAFGGNFIKWLYVVLGLMPGILSVTGALLWLRKRKRNANRNHNKIYPVKTA